MAQYYCPVLTALDKNAQFDRAAQHALYDSLIKSELDGVIVLGSAGEFYAFNDSEKEAIALDAISYLKESDLQVFVGTSSVTAQRTVEFSRKVLDAGADGVILVGPYYIGCTDEGFEAFYDEVCPQIPGKVLLYNYPERTGHDLTPASVRRLVSKYSNIVGIKDTCESATHTQKYISVVKADFPQFKVFSGFDNNLVPVVLAGGDGCIGGLSNLIPQTCAQLASALTHQNFELTYELHALICRLMDTYSITAPFMPVMKYQLQLKGLPLSDICRLPALSLTDTEKSAAEKFYTIIREGAYE